MNQGILFDLDKQEFGLSLIEGGQLVHYHAKRIKGDTFYVRRTIRFNGVVASAVERTVEDLDAFEVEQADDAFTWFVRGIKGMPARFLELSNGQHSF